MAGVAIWIAFQIVLMLRLALPKCACGSHFRPCPALSNSSGIKICYGLFRNLSRAMKRREADTVTESAGLFWPIVKDVTKVTVTVTGSNFCPDHPVTIVNRLRNGFRYDRL
jgi:hypothetical protein